MPIVLPPEARGNRNVAVLGPPGSGKSRAYVRNNLFQAVKSGWSVIVTDPKGELTRDFRQFFEDQGYKVRVFNLVSMINSDRWNPLSEVTTDIDAQMFCEVVISNTNAPGRKSGDPFWDRAETNLLKALALYCVNELPSDERNMGSLYKILASGDSKYLDTIFGVLPYDHPAKMSYNIYAETSPQVRSGVIIGLGTRLQVFQNALVRSLTETSDIDLIEPGKEKCAYFCIVSDMDHTFDFLASLFFSFLFINLTRHADRSGGELQIPTNFLLDEFCNIGHIPDFPKKISTMRGRGIACSVIFQSIGQLMSFYPDMEWETIMADCDSWLVLGVKDVTSAKYISDHMGVGTIETTSHSKSVGKILDLGKDTKRFEKRNLLNPDEITRMDRNEAILSAFGLKPLKLTKMDYTKHPMSGLLKPSPVSEYDPGWAVKEEVINLEVETMEASETAGEEDAFWS
jgi:type IV secretion system protein VirD4